MSAARLPAGVYGKRPRSRLPLVAVYAPEFVMDGCLLVSRWMATPKREQVAVRANRVGRPVECVGHGPAYRAAISPIDPSGDETGRGSGKGSLHPRRISLTASSQVVPESRRSQLSRKHQSHSFQVSPANTARPTRPKCSANSTEEPCIPMIIETMAMVGCGRN